MLATDQERRELRWFGRPLAVDIASQSGEMTVFVPNGSIGFVAVDDGSISLKNIVISALRLLSPQAPVLAAVHPIAGLDSDPVTVTLQNIGADISLVVECPDVVGWC